jgi:hypothetical protein
MFYTSGLKPITLLGMILVLVMLAPIRSAADDNDPPTRVARLNFIQGSVSYQPGSDDGNEDWVAADPNRPLTTGDNLWSDENSRGEVHIGSTSIRLSNLTGISFLNLDDSTIQIQLTQGTMEVRVRNYNPDNAYEIDTPNLAFTIYAPGRYRIQTDPDGNSTIILVREGQGQVTGGGQSYDIASGQRYIFSGTDQLSYDVQPATGLDAFEMWSQSRNQREDSSLSARYVSRDMDGAYDLDDNGDWQQDPEYGAIWIPRGVAAGWAPYHDGHWVWVSPWGWTWVDSQPWGFAPFHYGRWAYVRGYWGWVPGPPAVRPVYAPALVAFVGGGPGGFGISVGFGGGFAGVAWFPLGPRDVYLPSYRTSAAYVQNINVSNTRVVNVTQVTNVYNTYHTTTIVNNVTVNRINYTYANNAAAVTAVSRETFVGAKAVQAAAVRVTPEQLQSARVVEVTPLAPTRASYVSATARVTPQSAKPPVAFTQKAVVARIAPPTPPARPGVAPRAAPRVVSAGVAPKGGQPAARTTAPAPSRANQPPARTGAVAQPPARVNAPVSTVIDHPARSANPASADRPGPPDAKKPAAAPIHPNEIPVPASRATPDANVELDKKRQQEQAQLQAQQQQEREKVQQQQELEHQQLAQQKADEARKQQLEQQHQQQTQQLQQKHEQEQQQLQQKQQKEKQQEANKTAPKNTKDKTPPQ